MSIDLERLRSDPGARVWPWELIEKILRNEDLILIPIEDIASIDKFQVGPNDFLISIRTVQPVDIDQFSGFLKVPMEQVEELENVRLRGFFQGAETVYLQDQPQRVWIGPRGRLIRMIESWEQEAPRKASEQIKAFEPDSGLVKFLAGSASPIRVGVNWQLLAEAFRRDPTAPSLSLDDDLPEYSREDLLRTAELLDNVVLELDPTSKTMVRLSASARDEGDLEALHESLSQLRLDLLRHLKSICIDQVNAAGSLSERIKNAITNYANRMEKILVENSWWKIEGDRVVLEIDESKLYSVRGMTWIAGVLVPALFAVNNDSTELDMAPDNLDHE